MEKKIAVVQFPGSNCEDESIFALKRAGIPCEQFLWNAPVERLKEYAGILSWVVFPTKTDRGPVSSRRSIR